MPPMTRSSIVTSTNSSQHVEIRMSFRLACFALLASAVVTPATHAQEAGAWLWRAGAHTVAPKSNNNSLVNVDSASMLTFDVTYLPIPSFGIELLAALPFEHDINLNSGGKIATTRQLPPTMTFQYRPFPAARLRPYAGLGTVYTLFYDEKTTGALRGSKLQLRDSFGTTFQVGMDVPLSSNWFVNFDARWLEIETRAKLNGTDLGTVELDPYAVGLSIGRSF